MNDKSERLALIEAIDAAFDARIGEPGSPTPSIIVGRGRRELAIIAVEAMIKFQAAQPCEHLAERSFADLAHGRGGVCVKCGMVLDLPEDLVESSPLFVDDTQDWLDRNIL